MSHNDTEIKTALQYRLGSPDVMGFKEHCQRLGLESAERCVMLAMDDVINQFERRMQVYYERKIAELVNGHKARSMAFAEYCANYGEKGVEGSSFEHHWRGNVMAGEPELTTEELYSIFGNKK